jgi:very-short-patch-repair endonuclease
MRVVHRLSRHQRAVVKARARAMRPAPTASEAVLWAALSGRKLGVTFRRQVPLLGGRYITDFYAAEARLVVEVDGAWHATRRAADARRDSALQVAGCRVVRLEAELVLQDLGAAVERIRKALI